MSLLSLIARLGIDISPFDRGLNDAKNKANKFGNEVAGNLKNQLAGAFSAGVITAGFVKGVKDVAQFADKIAGLADRLGVSRDFLQQIDYAATLGNTTLDDMVGVMQRLAVSREKALGDPDGKAAQFYKKLGQGADELKSKRLDVLLLDMATAMEKAGDPQQVITAAIETMGRSAPEVFTVLFNNLAGTMDEFKKLGAIIDDEVVTQLADATDQIDILAMRMRSGFAPFASVGARVAKNIYTNAGAHMAGYIGLVEEVGRGGSWQEAGQEYAGSWERFWQDSKEEDAARAKTQSERRKRLSELVGKTDAFTAFDLGDGEKQRKEKERKQSPTVMDGLARIGGFGIGADFELRSVAKQQLTELREIKKNTGPFNPAATYTRGII